MYAWFIPLWPPKTGETAQEYIKKITNFFLYEYDQSAGDEKENKSSIRFHWEEILINPKRTIDTETGATVEKLWREMQDNPESFEAFSKALMEASILLPPLYVGKTDDLRGRYLSHVKGTTQKNDFHNRFSKFTYTTNYKLAVSDLLFVCIKTSRDVNNIFIENKFGNLNFLIEQIIMRISRPPFSLK